MATLLKSSKLINILKNKDGDKDLYYTLKDIKNKAREWYPNVTFPGWTYHCEKHVNEVERLLDNLIPEKMKRAMIADEIFILLAACYWHDFGMSKGPKARSKHNVISRDSLYDVKRRKDARKFVIFPNPSHVYAKATALLCFAHRDHRESNKFVDTLAALKVREQFYRGPIHLQVLGCLLRLADEFDLTQQRFPAKLYGSDFKKYNKFLKRHALIRRVEINSKTFGIKIHVDEDMLPYRPTAKKILSSIERKLNRELVKISAKLANTTEDHFELGYRNAEFIVPKKKKDIYRKHMVNYIADETNLSKKEAERFVETLEDSIISALKRGERVALIGFGTFSVAKRKARAARNPKTGKLITVSPKKSPKFKPGRELKKAVK